MQLLREAMSASVRKTDSPLEKKIVDELVKYEELRFETQYQVGKYRLDFAFPKYKICLEVDGHDYHNTEKQKAHDRIRDAYLTEVKGWIVERVPGWFAYKEPEATVVKAVRHIPGIEKEKQFQIGRSRIIQWAIRDKKSCGEAVGEITI